MLVVIIIIIISQLFPSQGHKVTTICSSNRGVEERSSRELERDIAT
jgi:hypothetical protein